MRKNVSSDHEIRLEELSQSFKQRETALSLIKGLLNGPIKYNKASANNSEETLSR
jgi:hypothetical protein